jgi:acetyl esterase/lipase
MNQNVARMSWLAMLCVACVSSLFADEQRAAGREVIEIWPDQVPMPAEEETPEHWGKWGLVNVHTPTLTRYPADPKIANGLAILILPGGGYSQVCINHEGHRVGEWFSAKGVSAFVLKYRVKPYRHPVPLLDAQRAMRYIRHNAPKFGIDPDRIGVMGFSAGGHLAASLSVHHGLKLLTPTDQIDLISARPNFSVLVYPVISMAPEITHRGSRNNLIGSKPDAKLEELMSADRQVCQATPPAFLVHGQADKGVSPQNSEHYYAALQQHKVPSELVLVEGAGHGFGLRYAWADKCLTWLLATVPPRKRSK